MIWIMLLNMKLCYSYYFVTEYFYNHRQNVASGGLYNPGENARHSEQSAHF